MTDLTNLKVALVHDFLREYGGGERVLEALHQLFPQAPVYVAFKDQQALGKHWARFADWDLRETWFAKLPFCKKLYSPLRIFAPHAFASLDLSQYDLVISSSNAFEAKAVQAPNGRHFCYCHTPPRALYGYSTMSAWDKHFLVKLGGTLINHYMRVKDFQAAQQVDQFIANSKETQARIKKFYKRDSVIIYPPVDTTVTAKLKPLLQRDYYFYIGRLGLQKHPELAVQACQQLDLPLKVAGTGPMLSNLKQLARDNDKIEFLGAVADDQLKALYVGAKALLYPVEDEDFGMVPVEAMAAGTPVLAHASGGPLETIVPGQTGLFFEELTVAGMVEVIGEYEQKLQDDKKIFVPQSISQQAQTYSCQQFYSAMKNLLVTY